MCVCVCVCEREREGGRERERERERERVTHMLCHITSDLPGQFIILLQLPLKYLYRNRTNESQPLVISYCQHHGHVGKVHYLQ